MPIVKEIKQHKILLDTHVWIWLAEANQNLSSSVKKAIETARLKDNLLISPITIWEISKLVEKRRIILEMDLMDWVDKFIGTPGIITADFSFEVALLSNRLPGVIHGDPADRILIASAFVNHAVLISADEKILEYGKNHFISVHNPLK